MRDRLSSRLGFILISAGCAIGLGNVYRFPITTGAYGGGIFVLIYLAFLILLGIPVMTAELSVGRAGKASAATSFDNLEPKGSKWHIFKFGAVAGNYLLMMFYTAISGWMLTYCIKFINGSISSAVTPEAAGNVFVGMISDPLMMIFYTFIVIALCFFVCSLGLQKGVEKITKIMMAGLLILIVVLAVHSLTLDNAAEGIKFYLVPSLDKLMESGISTVMFSAMGQAFFTLSLGIGSIAIFGSYIDKNRSLLGEAAIITCLDTFVAICAGLIIFPACFSFNGGQTADAGSVGASFLFTTLASLFNHMPGGRIWGALFFLFMIFASFSTVIAVFENIVSFWLETTKLSRKAVSFINIGLLMLLSLPAIFSLNIWGNVTIFGKGFFDLEDILVSNILLPLGSLIYVLFCTSRYGWGWKNYFAEVNAGKGIKMPAWIEKYMKYVLPAIIILVFVSSVLAIFGIKI